MFGWVYEVFGQCDDDLFELYCGNGNFILFLVIWVCKVLVIEISKFLVNVVLVNLVDNVVDNVSLVCLLVEELIQVLNEVCLFCCLVDIDLKSYVFGSVFVDLL